MRIVSWGTYDLGKPRTRILLRGLKENEVDLVECHKHVWESIEDKSQISGFIAQAKLLIRWLLSYPALIIRYCLLPRHDAILVGYLGHLDVLILWPFAKIRGTPIVWDAFISLYNTFVEDRKIISPKNPLSHLLFFFESLSCKAADLILLDTQAHANYFIENYNLPSDKVKKVLVGVEPESFPAHSVQRQKKNTKEVTVLFYGQFIPLHGIETIIQAARLANDKNISWVLIGKGQDEKIIRNLLDENPINQLQWIPWIPYNELVRCIHTADICLGIFGGTDKAARVIPNKVFQILSSGVPLITQDSPSIRELVNPDSPGIILVPPVDPSALVEAVYQLIEQQNILSRPLHRKLMCQIEPYSIGNHLVQLIKELIP